MYGYCRLERWLVISNEPKNWTLLVERHHATLANAIVSVGLMPNGTHFEPQRASAD